MSKQESLALMITPRLKRLQAEKVYIELLHQTTMYQHISKKKNLTIFFLRYIFVLSELCRSKLFGNCLDINFIPATKHKEWPFNKDSLPEVKYVLLE